MYNYHTHTNWCDGKSTADDIVKKAISLNYKAIGFSGHAPTSLCAKWQMSKEGFVEYKQKIRELQKQYVAEIEIYLGVEADFIPNIAGASNFKNDKLDYIIGSVHYVESNIFQQQFLTIDASPEVFEKGVRSLFNSNVENAVKTYFEAIRQMLQVEKPNIIGHLDLVKKFNKNNCYFNENDNWYKAEIEKTIEIVKESQCLIEINTRGYYKKLTEEFYPSTYILNLCKEHRIPIVVNSDTHHVDELSKGRQEVFELLKKIGITSHTVLCKNNWIEIDI
ncbi:MAG TPA: histidinol-phosphatase [Bacteroidales bacterium]|nr:MAG: hypothetical protein A2W98_03660 [Bacteroidetes bacterium GWF2_33_38]OFY84857.1 MAG: hypothetical protein A2236_09305 [Bacteroidetes bacterium RIFOXYA2_FULL_33_7]HBF87515.1 histidinol-phosphatase [Bacteroidales bacterium]